MTSFMQDGDRVAVVDDDGVLHIVLKGSPCTMCSGSGMIAQPDRTVIACVDSLNRESHY